MDIAQKLSRKLGLAEHKVAELERRIVELEAQVQLYRDKSERAEAWINKISSEIQQQVTGKPN